MKNTRSEWPSRGGGRRRAPRIALAAALVVLGAGCYPKAGPAPGALSADAATRAAARWPGVTPDALTAGRDLFIAKCNRCHDYPDLSAIPEDRWSTIVERMAKKADLRAAEGDEVLHFILAARSEKMPP
ncbi:MAG: hypothetical protein U0359_33550 [Byssovorax sp.]